jgi:hypothetical protein
MLGWGKYLHIDDLSLVICKEKQNQSFYSKKAADIGVKLLCHPNNEEEISRSELLNGIAVDPIDVCSWRFSYWLERKILRRIKDKKKSLPARMSFSAMDDYYHTLNSSIFFSKNIIKRAGKLYDIYKKYPNLSKRVGNESQGGNFEDEHKNIPAEIYKKTFFQSEYTDLTLSTYIEHRSRIAILKSAVDFTLFENHGIDERVEEQIKLLGLNFSLKNFLPDSFLNALGSIQAEPFFHRYPVFWQQFLWLFGGFILNDYKTEEYKLLSLKTGIPVCEIDNALSAYEKLFPIGSTWFKEPDGNSNIKAMKMMCVPFMGIGANLRKYIYTEDNQFESMKLSGTYTKSDLISWNNLVVDILA